MHYGRYHSERADKLIDQQKNLIYPQQQRTSFMRVKRSMQEILTGILNF